MTIGASQSKGDWKKGPPGCRSLFAIWEGVVFVGFRILDIHVLDHSQRKIEEKKIDQAPNLQSAANPHPGVPKQPKKLFP